MRIDLNVPYSQKERAKLYGAKWDSVKKTWYVIDPENMSPLKEWLKKPEAHEQGPLFDEPLQVGRPDVIPDCRCAHVAPWEHCEHSLAMQP